jgi:hypothetical protein
MPARRPLVIIGGQLAQLPAGDTIDGPVSEVDIIALNNSTASSVAMCRAVYPTSAGLGLAQANASATKNVIGLVKDTAIAAGANGNIQSDGVFVATTAQWSAVSGETNGLTPNSIYYLSATTPGAITSTPPSTAGQYVVQVGIALSATALDIRDSGFDILL